MLSRQFATLAVMAGTVLAAIALISSPQPAADACSFFGGMVAQAHEASTKTDVASLPPSGG